MDHIKHPYLLAVSWYGYVASMAFNKEILSVVALWFSIAGSAVYIYKTIKKKV